MGLRRFTEVLLLIPMLVGVFAAHGQPTAPKPAMAHRDRQGEPLPKGALARLDTPRFRPPRTTSIGIWQVAYAPDGKHLAIWWHAGPIDLWEAAPWRRMHRLEPKLGDFMAMAFSPAGNCLTTTEGDLIDWTYRGMVCHWDATTGKRLKEFRRDAWLSALCYSADGKTLAGSQFGWRPQRGFILRDPATGTERGRIIGPNAIEPVCCLSPDGRLLVWRRADSCVAVWDTRQRKYVRQFGKGFMAPQRTFHLHRTGASLRRTTVTAACRLQPIPTSCCGRRPPAASACGFTSMASRRGRLSFLQAVACLRPPPQVRAPFPCGIPGPASRSLDSWDTAAGSFRYHSVRMAKHWHREAPTTAAC